MKRKRKASEYIVIALILFAVWFYRNSLSDIWWGIKQITAKELLLCVGLAAIYFLLDGCLVYLAAKAFTKDMKLSNGIFISYICEFYRLITLGSGTFVAEIYYLCKRGLSPAQGTTGSAYKFAFKKAAIMILGMAGVGLLYQMPKTRGMISDYKWFILFAFVGYVAIILAFLLVSISKRIAKGVIWLIEKLAARYPKMRESASKWIEQIENLSHEGIHLWGDLRRDLLLTVINLLKFIAIYFVIAVLLNGKGGLDAIACIAIMALSYWVAGVLPTPSGVMTLEYAFGLFMSYYLEVGVYIPAILTFRFFTWIFPAGIGGILQLYNHLKNKENPIMH